MADVIKLVQSDNLPNVTLTLTDADGVPIDLSAGTTAVTVKFRQKGSTTVLATLTTTKINTGSGGQVYFNFPGATLTVTPGSYEGEIDISFNGQIQTVYQTLSFQVRARF